MENGAAGPFHYVVYAYGQVSTPAPPAYVTMIKFRNGMPTRTGSRLFSQRLYNNTTGFPVEVDHIKVPCAGTDFSVFEGGSCVVSF